MRRLAGAGWMRERAFRSDETLTASPERVAAAARDLGWGDPRARDGYAAISTARSAAATSVLVTGPPDGDLEAAAAMLRRAVDG
jgi:hypothetical protein